MKTSIRTIIMAAGLLGSGLAAHAQTDETVVGQLRSASNLTVFSRLVEACGLQDELSKVRDEEYERAYLAGDVQDLPQHPSMWQAGTIPEHRRYGFTVFAETDNFYATALGKAASSITPADVRQWLSAQGYYTGESDPLRQYVTYHLLPERLTPDKLVIHYNERGYNYAASSQPTIFVSEHYETLGDGRRLLQLSDGGGVEGIYLNRCPVLDNGMKGTYREVSAPLVAGIPVDTAQVIAALNGVIYPLSHPLVYTNEVRTKTLGGRIRYDVTSLLPEMMNNDLRRPMTPFATGAKAVRGFSTDYPYFDGLELQAGTDFYYLSGLASNWLNLQGDEFSIVGHYDFTLKLPPVPTDGVYELRLAVQSNSNTRGLALLSIGTDKNNLEPVGLPVDMRVGGQSIRYSNVSQPSTLAWETDVDDDVQNRFVDLRLHEQGYMKGANSYSASPGSTTTARTSEWALRRVVWQGEVKAGETLYLRVQNGLDNDTKQFYLDYLEWCPASVYDNSSEPEDIW